MLNTEIELKNENVEIKVNKHPGCRIELASFVSPLATNAAYHQAVKNINKEVSLPGFRKGRAPDQVIEQNYRSHIEEEWKEILVQTAFRESLHLLKIYPLTENSVKRPQIKKYSKEEGAHILFEYEAAPVIPNIQPQEITLKSVEKKPVTTEQINEAIENIRYMHAEWQDITDRPVEEGDFVDLDIDIIESPAKNLCSNTRFEVSKKKMGNWLRKLIIGMSVDQSADGVSEQDPEVDEQSPLSIVHHSSSCDSSHHHEEGCCSHDHSHEHESKAEFKPTKCRVTVKAIKKAILPNFDDELAKKAQAQNVEELKAKISQNLEIQSEQEQKQALRNQLTEILLEKYPVDLPQSMIENEKLSFIKKRKKEGKPASLDEKKEKEIKTRLSLMFLMRSLAKDAQATIAQDEILNELTKQMWLTSSEDSLIDFSMPPEEVRSRIMIKLMIEKCQDYLINQARMQ